MSRPRKPNTFQQASKFQTFLGPLATKDQVICKLLRERLNVTVTPLAHVGVKNSNKNCLLNNLKFYKLLFLDSFPSCFNISFILLWSTNIPGTEWLKGRTESDCFLRNLEIGSRRLLAFIFV